MKKFFLFILLNIIFIKFVFAEIVTLEDGRTIELKEDGTFTVISKNSNSNFEDSIKVNATESVDDWSGFYLGFYQSEDNLSASATSVTYSDYPYSVSTDKNMNNSGSFVGYNYSINDIIVGIEASYQDNVGKDEALSGLDGSVEYDDMKEYKLKIGYSFNRYLAYTFFGSGDLNVYWSDYANEVTSTHNYETKGIGLSAKITNNTFVGLSFSETNLDLWYPDTYYLEAIQFDSLRLRFGYLF